MGRVRLAGPSKSDPFKAHIMFKGTLFNPTHIYLNPILLLSDPLNTPSPGENLSIGLTSLWFNFVIWLEMSSINYVVIHDSRRAQYSCSIISIAPISCFLWCLAFIFCWLIDPFFPLINSWQSIFKFTNISL